LFLTRGKTEGKATKKQRKVKNHKKKTKLGRMSASEKMRRLMGGKRAAKNKKKWGWGGEEITN